MRQFTSVDEAKQAIGEPLGPSPWRVIDQQRVDVFANATDDHQWIHLDADRAATGPFGGTIAHGFLTLSMIVAFTNELYSIASPGPVINYGLNRVRFPAPVPVGSRVRANAIFRSIEPVAHGQMLTVEITVEVEGSDRPACVAESLLLLLDAST